MLTPTSVHHQSACVLAFHKHFQDMDLDPNAYAQDMDLVALDSRDDRDFPSW